MIFKLIPTSILIFFALLAFFVLNSSASLIFGFFIAILVRELPRDQIQKIVKKLLPVCVVGLGFGMNFSSVINAGSQGLLLSVFSIFFALAIGLLIGKLLSIDRITSYLISVGTAICGGSAIAAMAPVIGAKSNQIAVSLGIIFFLNSIALIIFPILGTYLGLSESEFGFWSAIAIHDTSSVVGAAKEFGAKALEIAVPVKLSRALWIIPLVWLSKSLFKNEGETKTKFPWFIIYFVFAALMTSLLSDYLNIWLHISNIAKKGLSLVLFLIGLTLSVEQIKSVGIKPLLQAVLLWILISVSSLSVIILLR